MRVVSACCTACSECASSADVASSRSSTCSKGISLGRLNAKLFAAVNCTGDNVQ
jgi:hypothetical protein